MKIKINLFTYILYLILIISGYINYLFIFILIMLTHEIGHIITIKIFDYKINSINIYPFGGIINTNINYNIDSLKLFIISISGILAQILLFMLISNDNTNNYHIFKMINTSIILINILPIYPFDGYKVLISILECIFSYRKTIIISGVISMISLIIYIFISNNIYLFIMYYILNIKYFINYKYIYNKFLLERYLYKILRKKDKVVNNLESIYKNYNNYIIYGKILVEEERCLKYKYM